MLPRPQHLAGGKAGQGRIRADADQLLAPAHQAGELVAALDGAVVAPDDGAAQGFAELVRQHEAVHLAGQGQSRDVRGIDLALLQYVADRGERRVHPVLRLLLRPAVIGLVQGIFHRAGRYCPSLAVEQDGLRAGCTQVHTNDILHRSSSHLQFAAHFAHSRIRNFSTEYSTLKQQKMQEQDYTWNCANVAVPDSVDKLVPFFCTLSRV